MVYYLEPRSEKKTLSNANGAHQAIFRQAGECGLLVEFGDALDDRINNAVHAFDARLRREQISGISETAPTIRSVLVRFDPLETPPEILRTKLSEILQERDWLASPPPENRTLWRIPTLYGGAEGPDMSEVAELLSMSEDAAIEQHSSTRQRVYMLGFAPGFTYLGPLPEAWNLPRLTEVKPEIPPGSICVAVRQTVLCSTTIPTGWHLIARTPFRSFHVDRDPAFLLDAGDEVIFEAIDKSLYDRLSETASKGGFVGSRERLS